MRKSLEKTWRNAVGITYKGQRFVSRKNARIGDMALSVRETVWMKEGKLYPIIEHKGRPAIVAEDGFPMPIHYEVSDRYFEFYRKYNLSVKDELKEIVKGVLRIGNAKAKGIN